MFMAKALHWVNYNGVWHQKGDEFPIADADAGMMRKYAVVTGQPEDKPKPQEPARRGRRRKE